MTGELIAPVYRLPIGLLYAVLYGIVAIGDIVLLILIIYRALYRDTFYFHLVIAQSVGSLTYSVMVYLIHVPCVLMNGCIDYSPAMFAAVELVSSVAQNLMIVENMLAAAEIFHLAYFAGLVSHEKKMIIHCFGWLFVIVITGFGDVAGCPKVWDSDMLRNVFVCLLPDKYTISGAYYNYILIGFTEGGPILMFVLYAVVIRKLRQPVPGAAIVQQKTSARELRLAVQFFFICFIQWLCCLLFQFMPMFTFVPPVLATTIVLSVYALLFATHWIANFTGNLQVKNAFRAITGRSTVSSTIAATGPQSNNPHSVMVTAVSRNYIKS